MSKESEIEKKQRKVRRFLEKLTGKWLFKEESLQIMGKIFDKFHIIPKKVSNKNTDRILRIMLSESTQEIESKYFIILKTDPPEKHVELDWKPSDYFNASTPKLKWRDKK